MDENFGSIKGEALESLSQLWNEIGFNEEEKLHRLAKINGAIKKYVQKMEDDEARVKQRLISDIDKLGDELCKLTSALQQDILTISEPDIELSLLQLKSHLQEQLLVLEQEVSQRQDILMSLREEEMVYCERLGEDPWDGPEGEIPSKTELQYLKDVVKTLEKQKLYKEKNFRALKCTILRCMEELEQEPSTVFQRDIALEVEEIITLSDINLRDMKKLSLELEAKLQSVKDSEAELNNDICALWDRLTVDEDYQTQFLSRLGTKTIRNLPLLQEEFARLEELKIANIGFFIEQLRIELKEWWDRCYVSETEQNDFSNFTTEEYSEEVLLEHETRLKELKDKYKENEDIYKKVDEWCALWTLITKLEEKSNDPNRLFGNRGCSLLREEKERKRVTKELPRIEKDLEMKIAKFEEQTNSMFLVCGFTLTDFIKCRWENYNQMKMNEKMDRQEARTKQLLLDAKVRPTRSSKRPNSSKDTPQTSKFRRTGEHDRTPINGNTTKFSSTPQLLSSARRTPLRERNAKPKVDDTFQTSACSYNKFSQGIGKLSERDTVRSSIGPGTRSSLRPSTRLAGLPKTPVRSSKPPTTPQRRTPMTLPRNFGRRQSTRQMDASSAGPAKGNMTSRMTRTKPSSAARCPLGSTKLSFHLM